MPSQSASKDAPANFCGEIRKISVLFAYSRAHLLSSALCRKGICENRALRSKVNLTVCRLLPVMQSYDV